MRQKYSPEILQEGQDIARYLSVEFNLPFTLMSASAKEIYASGCDYIIEVEARHGLVIKNAIPHSPGFPKCPTWVFSLDAGDMWQAEGESIGKLLSCPGVREYLSTGNARNLPRSFGEIRKARPEKKAVSGFSSWFPKIFQILSCLRS